ncbi:hypothetical protein N2152v2_004296 [Parachlorella kessleri]
MSSVCASQQGMFSMLALPGDSLDTISGHLSVVEKVYLACSCKTLWGHSNPSSNWWQSLDLQPPSDSAAEHMAAWIGRRGSLVHQLQLSLDKCSPKAVRAVLLAVATSYLPNLQSLEVRCAPPADKVYGPPPASHPGYSQWEFDDLGSYVYLPPDFSLLTSLTSLSASGFSCLGCPPACLPAGLRSLTIDLCPPEERGCESAAKTSVFLLARAAAQVSALQSLSIVVAPPRADPDGPYAELFLDLAPLRDPWARQLTQLSVIGQGRAMDLEQLAGLRNLQQLHVAAKNLHRDWARARRGWGEEPEPEAPLWQPQPLAALGALMQLRSVRLDSLDLPEAEMLQPVWSLPLLEVELLTIVVIGSSDGNDQHVPFPPDVLEEFAAQCPGLRKVEFVHFDGSEAPSARHLEALADVLPVTVELALQMAGAALS